MGLLWRGGEHSMAAPQGSPNHEMLGNEEVSDHTMPGGHGVVTPGIGWHGACMEQPSIDHDTPHCAHVPVWRLRGSAGQGSAGALNLWPLCHTQRRTNHTPPAAGRPHTVAAGVKRGTSTFRSVATVPGPVRWHGVDEGLWGRVHSPPKVQYQGLVRQYLTCQPQWRRGATGRVYAMDMKHRNERIEGLGACYGWGQRATEGRGSRRDGKEGGWGEAVWRF